MKITLTTHEAPRPRFSMAFEWADRAGRPLKTKIDAQTVDGLWLNAFELIQAAAKTGQSFLLQSAPGVDQGDLARVRELIQRNVVLRA